MTGIDLFDYKDGAGRNLIQSWLHDDHISRRDRAKLNQKLDILVRLEPDLALKTRLLAKVAKDLLKLRVYGEIQLRPMLCRGPVNNDGEYTLLAGAVEVGGRLPKGIMGMASGRREHVIGDPARHRCAHEPFE